MVILVQSLARNKINSHDRRRRRIQEQIESDYDEKWLQIKPFFSKERNSIFLSKNLIYEINFFYNFNKIM